MRFLYSSVKVRRFDHLVSGALGVDTSPPCAARAAIKADIRPGVTGALTAKVKAVERYLQA